MTSQRKTHRRDNNHKVVVEALRAVGATVLDMSQLGDGAPDLLVGWQGQDYLVELKDSGSRYGKKGLSAAQEDWADRWHGSDVIVIDDVVKAYKMLGIQGFD